MRKMYFAMIPKRSFLENAAVTAGAVLGALYGAKFLLGDEKYNEYKEKVKNKVFNSGAAELPTQASDTGVGIADVDSAARSEETILERIRQAAKL